MFLESEGEIEMIETKDDILGALLCNKLKMSLKLDKKFHPLQSCELKNR